MGGSDDANGDNDGAEAASQLTDVLRALEENDETPEALASVHVIIDEVRTFACTSEFHPILHDIFRLLAPGQRADMLEALNPASERDDVDIAMLISSDELSASLMHEILRSQENDDESQRVDEEIQMLLNTNAEAVLLYKRLRTWMLEQERSALLNDISIDEWGLDPEGAFYVERALTSDVLPEKAKSAMRDQVIMQTLAWATDPLGSKLILRAFQTGGEESRHLVSSMLSVCLATVAADVHGRKLWRELLKQTWSRALTSLTSCCSRRLAAMHRSLRRMVKRGRPAAQTRSSRSWTPFAVISIPCASAPTKCSSSKRCSQLTPAGDPIALSTKSWLRSCTQFLACPKVRRRSC